ncbi:AraC family transcriptional regulator [Mesorhizobium sp. L-8-10]|uniref:AraC family transcriptional regulator n=1 Tax=Mesorhizobium sp. L-8-10 TaxID=2744523 RepID=UPI0019269B4A|nr:AraC family transcriptional regulator [Mesorhizobium sp. L-8-10]
MAKGFRMIRCGMRGVEAIVAETRHSFPRHSHQHYGIGVVHRGAQRSFSGRGMVEAGPGDTITVNPGEVHDGMPIGDDGRAWSMLYFEPAMIQGAADDIADGAHGTREFHHPAITSRTTANIFLRLFAAATGPDDGASQIRCDELLLSLLAGLIGGEMSEPARAVPMAIRRARALIDDAPAMPVTLADLARESGLSRFQVLRGFARATGRTPHAYIMQRRIDLARSLIAGGMPLAEAAAAGGFADQSHMTRLFVRSFGISPGVYADAVT